MEGSGDFQKMFLSGGVTNILTLLLFYVLKIVSKKCDRTKSSKCEFCGSSCYSINKDTIRNARPRERDVELGGVPL